MTTKEIEVYDAFIRSLTQIDPDPTPSEALETVARLDSLLCDAADLVEELETFSLLLSHFEEQAMETAREIDRLERVASELEATSMNLLGLDH